MSLQPIQTSPSNLAERACQNFVTQTNNLAQAITNLRKNGLPAQEARTLPNGQVIPAQPAVTPAEIDAAFGAQNIAIYDALASAINAPAQQPPAPPNA